MYSTRLSTAFASPLEMIRWSSLLAVRKVFRSAALPANLAALAVSDGPFLFLVTSWHLVHFSALMRASAPATSTAEAVPTSPNRQTLAAASAILMLMRRFSRIDEFKLVC